MNNDSGENNNKTNPQLVSADDVAGLDEQKKKELVEKIKASLFVEDSENTILYASLLKSCAIP